MPNFKFLSLQLIANISDLESFPLLEIVRRLHLKSNPQAKLQQTQQIPMIIPMI